MINKDTLSDMFDSSVRVSRIIHLRSMFVGIPENGVWRLFEDEFEDILEAMDVKPPKEAMSDIAELGAVFLRRDEFAGLLVRFDTPVPRDVKEKGGYSCGWNMYHSKWFYCDTLQEACEKALVWQEAVVKEAYEIAGVEYDG
ncbi:hypothetical protein [Vibrio parahaemolyticus]|uniref:hypothetical protein n=1 Tax=Vibrio parahaemolyticus TaxID=670 RepID=UPI0011ECFF84|nr:hypothetical protein [Vibrio parahaemolyticus]KAB5599276.1 hypothetical protein F0578_11670 [Vibrio parahaemolyticus]